MTADDISTDIGQPLRIEGTVAWDPISFLQNCHSTGNDQITKTKMISRKDLSLPNFFGKAQGV